MKPNQAPDSAELRRRAEEQQKDQASLADRPMSTHEMQRLLQELQIHQIELEMQNQELQRAYADLETSQARYFDLYDLAPVGYAIMSEAGMILEANLTIASLLGVERGKLVRRPLSRWIFPEDLNLFRLHCRQLFATAESQVCEVRMVKPDGTAWWAKLVMTVPRQAGSRECRLVLDDITDRKRAEMQILEMKADLERKVAERTRELLETRDQYLHAEKLSAIGKLSASIAHEFNNPLQSVTTVMTGLGKYANLDEDEKKLLALALQECRRMSNLITNLQDFYRPTTGKFQSVDLHAVFDSLLVLAKKDFNTRKISITKEYAARLPTIQAVPDQLMQVFLNLLNNAADACGDDCRITLATEVIDGEKIVAQVRDNGAGIDPAHIGRIFEPFFTTKRHQKGTGLGLSVSYGIVKKHGGDIEVKSTPGKGTVFSVFLPVQGVNDERIRDQVG